MSDQAKPKRRPWWVVARSLGQAIILVGLTVFWELLLLFQRVGEPWRALFQILWAAYGVVAIVSFIYWLAHRKRVASRSERWYEE